MIESLQVKLERVVENESLAKNTNFRIGGPARYFFEATSSEEMVKAVTAARELGVPTFVLGGGSNVLVSDAGFDGLVIKAANRGVVIASDRGERGDLMQRLLRRFAPRNDKIVRVSAEAGVLSAFLARKTAEVGLTGFEWAISLPGTIGGAIRGNAGCFGGEMRDVVRSVEVFDPQKSERYTLNAERLQFSYRDSIFKHMEPAPIILSVKIELKRDDSRACLERIEATLRLRKEKQPLDASSAGCLFKNFEFKDRGEITRLESKLKVPEEFIVARRIPAGWIIDQLGLKGTRIGDVQVSEKHGNFMTNLGKATADEVAQLAALIKTRARNDLGIQLHEEVQYVGF
ncbi:UDP-N-acetylmuramate dehydrogenase [Candidatus Uhrbacteria bacterium]|nr:UDP-N-acetylmuramate dehydrogenase [Candidatus Uhrbacteria bacterium]